MRNLALVFLLAFVARLLFAWLAGPEQFSDFASYMMLGDSLASGDGYQRRRL